MKINVKDKHKETVPFICLAPGDLFILPNESYSDEYTPRVCLKVEEYDIGYSHCINMVDLSDSRMGTVTDPSKQVIRIDPKDTTFIIKY